MRILLLWLVITLLSACVGKPSRPSEFYVLAVEPGAASLPPASGAQPSIGLGPVSLPELLDRPQIVTRSSRYQVELAEYHRWGGELEQELVRALAQNLMTRLHTDDIRFYPWSTSRAPHYQVAVHFFRFDGSPREGAVLDGQWRLLDGQRECEILVQGFHIEQAAEGGGYAALVGAMSRGVGQLSDRIAAAVASARPGC